MASVMAAIGVIFLSLSKPESFDCLWFLVRHGLCFKVRRGKDCDDSKCIYGHEERLPMVR